VAVQSWGCSPVLSRNDGGPQISIFPGQLSYQLRLYQELNIAFAPAYVHHAVYWQTT